MVQQERGINAMTNLDVHAKSVVFGPYDFGLDPEGNRKDTC